MVSVLWSRVQICNGMVQHKALTEFRKPGFTYTNFEE